MRHKHCRPAVDFVKTLQFFFRKMSIFALHHFSGNIFFDFWQNNMNISYRKKFRIDF